MITKSNTNLADDMNKILLGVFCALLSFNGMAVTHAGNGQKWYGPFTINKFARYAVGTDQRVSVHVNEAPETSGAVSNSEKKFSYSQNNYYLSAQLVSALATAHAQNKRVMLLIHGNCDNNLGLRFLGVEILSD